MYWRYLSACTLPKWKGHGTTFFTQNSWLSCTSVSFVNLIISITSMRVCSILLWECIHHLLCTRKFSSSLKRKTILITGSLLFSVVENLKYCKVGTFALGFADHSKINVHFGKCADCLMSLEMIMNCSLFS